MLKFVNDLRLLEQIVTSGPEIDGKLLKSNLSTNFPFPIPRTPLKAFEMGMTGNSPAQKVRIITHAGGVIQFFK